MPHSTVSRLMGLLLGLILASAYGLAGARRGVPPSGPPQAAEAQEKTAAAKPASAAASDYAGAEACKTCHEDIYNGWEKSPHWKTTLNTKEGSSHQGCEACQGAAASHVADPTDTSKLFLFEKASPKEINARCLTCHASGTEHMHSIDSLHSRNDVACTSCHSPHHGKDADFLLIKAQPQLCYGCHLQQKLQFDMPFHHRVNEGLVQCTDCHNPHGTERPHQIRTSAAQDVACYTCHANKQGPFVYEHVPIKTEGCESCHTPHGGPNAHMLKVSNVNILCLQCHTASSFSGAPGTPSFHNQSVFFQACTVCHSQIHGSNFDPTFFK
jgi:DmsE family decaheme c-type cytochrome